MQNGSFLGIIFVIIYIILLTFTGDRRIFKETNCFESATLKVNVFIQILHGVNLQPITACT